jgi:hypothetical protein
MVDFNLDAGSPIKNRDVDLVLQQIELLFDTTPDDVFGEEDFGTQYDSYLYKLKMSAQDIETQVMSDICSLNLMGFKPEVNAHLLQGTEQDIILVQIILRREYEQYEKIYKITT